MAKASVPMALQTKHESKEERARREEMEKKLRGKRDKLVPVSYTHLDVYKRQS